MARVKIFCECGAEILIAKEEELFEKVNQGKPFQVYGHSPKDYWSPAVACGTISNLIEIEYLLCKKCWTSLKKKEAETKLQEFIDNDA